MNPQHEAHERMCKSIGDMAKENKRLEERIKQLEESLESANTFLQLVMCEQNHLRDVRNKANDRIKRLEGALAWYESKVSDCNRQGAEGDAARDALAKDYGRKAKEAKP
jgi:predicted  nucleic acid-binding Zn-ribbon protein